MIRLPFFLFLVFPLIEIYLLILVGSIIGAGLTLFLCISTAVIGGILVRQQGFSTLSSLQAAMARGEVPALEMLEGVILFVCGILLMIPGFLTDILAFLVLIPSLRRLLALWVIEHGLLSNQLRGAIYYRHEVNSSDYQQQQSRIIESQAKREDE